MCEREREREVTCRREGGKEGRKGRAYLKEGAVSNGGHGSNKVIRHVEGGQEGEVLQLLRKGGREGGREGGGA